MHTQESMPPRYGAPRREEAEPNMGMAVIAAGASGFVAMIVWFGLIHATGWEIGFAAWGVGVVIGFATLWGAGRTGFKPGVVAVVVTVFAILGGHYLTGGVSVFTGLWLILGVGSALKIAGGKEKR